MNNTDDTGINVTLACIDPDDQAYCGLYQSRFSKWAAIVMSLILISVDVLMFYGIIWFERFGTDQRRTLMNKLLTSVCWIVIGQLFLPLLDILR